MGMYGEWMRVSVDELEHGKQDLGWLESLVDTLDEADQYETDEIEVGSRRRFGTDKAWDAVNHVLQHHDFPVSIVFGEESFVDDEESGEGDWGYGPPRYLTPEQVRVAAEALSRAPAGVLIASVDRAELAREKVYPDVWNEPDSLDWVAGYLTSAAEYFAAAAAAGDGVVCWIA